jgi:dCMP deaminase
MPPHSLLEPIDLSVLERCARPAEHYRPDLVSELLAQAYGLAARSRDTSNQNGALILSCRGVLLGEGFNDLPIGVRDLPERHERPEKYNWFRHAEQHALLDAGYRGEGSTRDGVLVTPWAACMQPCAVSIIETGVRHLVLHKQRMELSPVRWIDNIRKAFVMFAEAGVTWELYDGEIGCDPVYVDGELWRP